MPCTGSTEGAEGDPGSGPGEPPVILFRKTHRLHPWYTSTTGKRTTATTVITFSVYEGLAELEIVRL